MAGLKSLGTLMLLLLTPAIAAAQGLLIDDRVDRPFHLPRPIIVPHPIPRPVPPPEQPYKIKELAVDATVQDQIAKVQVTQSFVNTGSRQMEVRFVFPLPYDGAVDRMTFLVDGKEYDARLLTAEEARRIYESYVRRNQDPALMEWIGTGMFQTSVFPVPAGAERTVTLRYSQLCRKRGGLTEVVFPLSTAKYTSHPVDSVRIRVSLQSAAKIKNIYSPSHAIDIKRTGDRQAVVEFSRSQEVPASDFLLMYDVGDKPLGASLLSYRPDRDEDGYFLLLVSPEIKASGEKPIPKTVVFVVDRSGSMSGKKIEQARNALKFVLNNLNEGDLFNIITYDSEVESYQPELQRFNDRSRESALGFVEGIYAGGSTNIDGALQTAFAQLKDDSRPNYVVFLTDGLPTAGERNSAKIADNARQRNAVRARVFSFGVGYDVNSRLLDQLSRICFGQSEYVRPDEDIEARVSQLYARIGAPVMTDTEISFDMEDFPREKGSVANRVYPREVHDLFAGDQLVVLGRYKRGGEVRIRVKGRVADESREFEFAAELSKRSEERANAYIEKLWAMRRVGEIIDEIDLKGKNEELIDELVALSKRHGIITPYTSFLADDDLNRRDLAEYRQATSDSLGVLAQETGRAGFVQRDFKAQLQRAAQAPAAGYGGGMGAAGVPLRDIQEDRAVPVQTVQHVGSKTFFLRGGQWVDSVLSAEQEQQVRRIERYSKEYFELVNRYGKEAAKYLAMDGNVVVVLDGQAYAF